MSKPFHLPADSDQAAGSSIFVGICAVLAAALAMAATMPGRTHGLGMITEPLLKDFSSLESIGQSAARTAASLPFVSAEWAEKVQTDEHSMRSFGFATLNFWATLLGSALCIPCGWLLDRFRIRTVGPIVVLGLALAVLGMSLTESLLVLAITLTLTRSLGQSMLSVVSLAIIGKNFPKRPGFVMAAYAVVMTMLMVVWMALLLDYIPKLGWRDTWWGMGLVLAAIAPVLFVLTPWRLRGKGNDVEKLEPEATASATLPQALRTPCFWTFAIAISLFGLITSGFSLFQQAIFEAQGLDRSVYGNVLKMGLAVGLVTNLLAGALAYYVPLQRLLFGAMVLLAASLAAVPYLSIPMHAYIFCVVYGVGGGTLSVLFFTVWGPAFGTRSLGRIQGAAQMLTVVFSAAGPLTVSGLRLASGSHAAFLYVFAGLSLLLGVVALFVPVPSAAAGAWERNRKVASPNEINPVVETV
jgi:MFS family permease